MAPTSTHAPTRRRAGTYLALGALAALAAVLLFAVGQNGVPAWMLLGLAAGTLLVGAAQWSSASDRQDARRSGPLPSAD